jgi:zinc transport system substrate-binding protein
MKRTLIFLIIFCVTGVSWAKEVKVVTSFYPVYIMALNVTKGAPGVSVVNLTPSIQGCLHDYSLTTRDMQKLGDADIFIVNGAGMEGFLENLAKQYPKLKVIKLADRIPLIDNNPHIWLSISGAIMQVKNLGERLAGLDPGNAPLYQKNTDAYVVKLERLGLKMYAALKPYKGVKIITLHDAFPYFAREFGLEIVAVVEREPDAQPSAKDLSEIIQLIKKEGVKAIFSDDWYPVSYLDTIAMESGASVYFIDPAVSGPNDPGAYIEIMQNNLDTLKEALK